MTLGIKTWTTGFNVWSEDNNFYTDYVTNPQGGFMSALYYRCSRSCLALTDSK